MTLREKFGEWWRQKSQWMLAADADDWEDVAFNAWKDSRAEALEDAAKECDLMQKHIDTRSAADAVEQCAMAVRALKD